MRCGTAASSKNAQDRRSSAQLVQRLKSLQTLAKEFRAPEPAKGAATKKGDAHAREEIAAALAMIE